MDLKDEVGAAHGVAIAQTALIAALIGVLRQRGVLDDVLVNVITDAAITQVEQAPEILPEHAMRARRVLEVIAAELAGPPKDRV
jgi:hypothetical protein